MFLDEIVAAQKRGESRGIPSICSAYPAVIGQTFRVCKTLKVSALIESTCNQVNQFGGYTGMTPAQFVQYVRGLAEEVSLSMDDILLGGDHLGPSVWQNEPAESAMQKSADMVRAYAAAGYIKLHLDCSMRLADDAEGPLDVEVSARRAAQLAEVAESAGRQGSLRYVIGTEVPIPGGATEHEETVSVTNVENARRSLEVTRAVFIREGLQSAWERVVAVVVQPGVEFGNDFVAVYRPEAARDLSAFIEDQPMVYEAHSTDYQNRDALTNLVRDHFAILKVGPALTFAFREAVFALAILEDDLIPKDRRSNIVRALDNAMLRHPEHWLKYYTGGADQQALMRKYSLSDRARYYWTQPKVYAAFEKLKKNLEGRQFPAAAVNLVDAREPQALFTFEECINEHIARVLKDYFSACGFTAST